MKAIGSSRKMSGVTLIELLISLAIGMVVVVAVLVSFVDSGKVSRFQTAVGQMNQDAQVALNLLTREVQMAGYISPGQTLGAPALFGCDSTSGTVPFISPSAAGAMTCNAATGTTFSSAIEVVYEADDKTTVPQGVAKTPSDCLGTGITVSGTIYITRNRYYVNTSSSGRRELHCASPAGGGVAQPLIENVEDMQLWYGVTTTAVPTQVIRYAKAGKDASTANTVNALGAAEWNNVMSVRICLLMRSAEPILTGDDTLTYLDCNSAPQTSADKYLRRAYFTTATVRTKMTS